MFLRCLPVELQGREGRGSYLHKTRVDRATANSYNRFGNSCPRGKSARNNSKNTQKSKNLHPHSVVLLPTSNVAPKPLEGFKRL